MSDTEGSNNVPDKAASQSTTRPTDEQLFSAAHCKYSVAGQMELDDGLASEKRIIRCDEGDTRGAWVPMIVWVAYSECKLNTRG